MSHSLLLCNTCAVCDIIGDITYRRLSAVAVVWRSETFTFTQTEMREFLSNHSSHFQTHTAHSPSLTVIKKQQSFLTQSGYSFKFTSFSPNRIQMLNMSTKLFYMKRVIILAFIVAKFSQVKDFQTMSSKESVDILDFVSLHTTAWHLCCFTVRFTGGSSINRIELDKILKEWQLKWETPLGFSHHTY